MRFSMHDFVMKGLLAAIGVQSDYWVILEAARWFDKGVLREEDLIEIQEKIDEKNIPVEPEPVEEPIEEVEEIQEENEVEE